MTLWGTSAKFSIIMQLCCKHVSFIFANENYFNENLNVYVAKKMKFASKKKEKCSCFQV